MPYWRLGRFFLPARAMGSSLRTYREKRDFRKTSEPPPRRGGRGGNQFVVQKHDARRLHFDLRLELDGVLKSWAVTRGPSLVPGEKRLAVQTEDHPMEYLEWEGVIPKGEYGGGTMIVWDRGTWEPDGDARKGLARGKLDFSLAGQRLKGRWHLVRMRRRPSDSKDQWLLIKGSDEYARHPGDPEIVEEEHTSVLTKRTNVDLAESGDIRADHAERQKKKAASRAKGPSIAKLKGARKAILPVFVEPSLALLKDRPPSGGNWIHEIKFDGYRLQARITGRKIELLTRRGLDWTKRFPTIQRALQHLPAGSALLDGELIVQDDRGLSSFSGLQSDLKSGRYDRMAYFVFDLLYYDGRDLRGIALGERRRILHELMASLPADSVVRFSEHLEGEGSQILQHACKLGLEGIVSKRIDLPYVAGRGEHWIKTKCVEGQEFVILGYVPSTALPGAVGSLVLGYYERGRLIHAGRAGTGFSAEQATALRRQLDSLPRQAPSLANEVPRSALKDVKWIAPKLVADVEYRGWSADGMLRQASFKGLREDKAPEEVRLEKPRSASSARSTVSIQLTHPERILWEDQGITKQGLADFYTAIAPWILPHLVDRVLSLVRCPSGVGEDCFYAKHAWAGLSGSIRRVNVGEEQPMLAIDDLDGLIALVQAGVLEIHPWGSRAGDLERPDRIIFDLDPGEGVEWKNVIAAALEVRDRLRQRKLKSFVKTTGGKGLHVVAPIEPRAGWAEVKKYTERLAEEMAGDSPKLYVTKMTKTLRRGRIFVDFLRNGRGATAVAAYSTRARPGASVSTPLTWDELSEDIAPNHYTLTNLQQRLDHLAKDPWTGFFSIKQTLPALEASAGTRRSRPKTK
jgi:bifunctional non-homologous end joining protein LigD